jgi:hypothetical protein
MLLSVTRTISIAFPLYQIRKYWVLVGSLIYSLVNLSEPILGRLDVLDYEYIYNGNNPNCFQKANSGLPFYFQYFLEAANILLISSFTFVSFVVTIFKLNSASKIRLTLSNANQAKSIHPSSQASITVAIFTAVFLVCNLPMFANVVLYAVTILHFSYPGPIFSVFYMSYYSWVVSKVVCVVLNASINPVVYFLRMRDFNTWIRKTKPLKISILSWGITSQDSS